MHLIIGCGYLGRRVDALWRAQGKSVAALTRSRSDELRALGLQPIVGDVLRPETLTTLPSADVILYAVGFDRTAGSSFRDVYVKGLSNVIAALPAPPRRFLYVSSTSVYGATAGEEIDETVPAEPTEDNGRIVLEAEDLLRDKLPDAIILRFAGIYGPGRLIRQNAIMKGEPLAGDFEKWINLIHVEDGARAAVAAEERGRPGSIYNISDGHPVRRRDFYMHLAELLNAPPPRFATLPSPSSERGNRRIGNRKLREELEVQLVFSSYREGLQASIA
jgi:nucleoside-diphosphate-sugar epimerase